MFLGKKIIKDLIFEFGILSAQYRRKYQKENPNFEEQIRKDRKAYCGKVFYLCNKTAGLCVIV